MTEQLKVGDTVYVPWGLNERVEATVVELWGEPPAHVRVQLHFGESIGEEDEPVILLLSPKMLSAA